MSKFIPNKENLWAALMFCFHLKKTAAESLRLLREAYGEHAPSKIRVDDGFGVSNVLTSIQDTKADKEHGKSVNRRCGLQALLDEDDLLTQK